MTAAVRYTVRLADLRAHLFEVCCTVEQPAADGQVFRMPGWLRGSYLVRDFAKHVVRVRAESDGKAVAIERLDKRSLRCAPVAGSLRLCYEVYALDASVRKAWLDTQRGFFNGSALFYCADGLRDAACELDLLPPDDALAASWKVATALPAVQADARGFGLYRAENYEALIDHPVEIADFQRVDFEVDGVPHALALSGRCEADLPRVAADLARICHVERELFGQQPQLPQYLFLTNVVGHGYGGLEHRDSCALIASRGDFPRPGEAGMSRDYRTFLGLCSHEYFHLWNVKRIRGARFEASDLGTEAYSEDLWHYEGVTSYYDDLFLLRAGVIDAPTYLSLLSEHATRLERAPGRKVQTLADASFEAWIKYYQPDENAPNANVSYYIKGALFALCLDLRLRRDSGITLDDVLREAWRCWGSKHEPVPEGGLERLAMAMSGVDLKAFFDSGLRGTEELPLAELLADFGVRATRRAAVSDSDGGGVVAAAAPKSSAGLKFRPGETRVLHVYSGGAAEAAGVAPNDVVVAVDELRVTAANFGQRIAALEPGKPVTLHLFRDDQLLTLDFTPLPPNEDTWVMVLDDGNDAAVARRRAWLGA